MTKRAIKEDEADKWLREHDPYYSSKNGHKRKQQKYPYTTARQEETRQRIEIPLSSLSKKDKVQLKGVLGAFDEGGEFNL